MRACVAREVCMHVLHCYTKEEGHACIALHVYKYSYAHELHVCTFGSIHVCTNSYVHIVCLYACTYACLYVFICAMPCRHAPPKHSLHCMFVSIHMSMSLCGYVAMFLCANE